MSPRRSAGARWHQAGFGLVELMIAMLLGMIILLAAMQIFLSSKQTFRMREQLARLAENGRFATELLQRDVRMAGYCGCRTLAGLTPNVIARNPPAFSTIADGLRGHEAGAGWVNPSAVAQVAGTDVLVVSHASGSGVPLAGNMAAVNANVQLVDNRYGFEADDVLLVTDCEAADLMRASNVGQGGGVVTIAHAMNTNTDNRLSKAYQGNAVVMGFESNTYFVGQGAGGSSLYMIPFGSAGAIELVRGVQDLQLRYALDGDGDRRPDSYASAAAVADWAEVIGVEVGLLLYTDDETTVEPQPYAFNGANANAANDRRLRSAFLSAVAVRNRLN